MTLTEAAAFTEKGVKYGLIPVTLIMVTWIIIRIVTNSPQLPQRYITPDYMCGPLDELNLQSLELGSETQFSIETTSGAIPDLPSVVNVFKYTHPGQSLLALQEAQRTAELLGFESESYSRISTTEYQWTNRETNQTLVIETSNQNITLTTNYTNPSVNTTAGPLPSEETAKTEAELYLKKMNLLTRDYSNGYAKTYLIQITADGQFREAPSLSEADLVRVDFFRTKELITIDPELVGTEEVGATLQEELEEEDTETIQIDDETVEVKEYSTKVYNDNPIFGNITVYVGGRRGQTTGEYQIFGIETSNWILGDLACGTYNLITPTEAVRKVQDGEGALVYLMEKGADRILPYETKTVEGMTIHEVSLNYLDLEERQRYMQPIYVIRGEADFGDNIYGEFYYYVPAIEYESIPDDAGTVPVEPEPAEGEAS